MAPHQRLSDVYGISRDLPLNYVPRDKVDGVFVGSLTRDKHIVVYGSSKQGKTSLRKYNLTEEDHVVVTCSNKWGGLAPLHTAVLKAAGYTIEQSTTKTAEGTFKVKATAGGEAGLPFVAKGKAEARGRLRPQARHAGDDRATRTRSGRRQRRHRGAAGDQLQEVRSP